MNLRFTTKTPKMARCLERSKNEIKTEGKREIRGKTKGKRG